MAIVHEIIKDAFRESNLIAIGQTPSSAQQDEALTLLNRLVASVYGNEVGDPLTTVYLGTNNTTYAKDREKLETSLPVPSNSRIVLNLDQAETIYLLPNPEDGARFSYLDNSGNLNTRNLTISGNGNKIGSANSAVVSTNGAKADYLFRQDLGAWVLVSPLGAFDTFPFPTEFDDFFVIGLAMRLNPRNEVALKQESAMSWSSFRKQLRARYRQTFFAEADEGLLRLTNGRRYISNYWSK